MTIVPVSLGDRSYDVLIEAGALDRAADLLAPYARERLIVVTDETVAQAQLGRIRHPNIIPIVLPAGEATKSWSQLESLCDQLLELEVERGEHIVALGGGVIGDLTGFAAAIVKRGIGFVQVPTTLLAQVDSSVGGKTAINARAGKNLIGAFHQPSFVLIDPTVLDTLPARELRAGYAEIVKYGLIDDPDFFAWCDEYAGALLAGEAQARERAIAHSVAAKARIVGEDERETADRRALLNLGHTFGHALEAETGFGSALLHGEAVAAGMGLAFRFSAERDLCPESDAVKVAEHLRRVGLPHDAISAGVSALGKRLAAHMAHDKKKASGRVPFILAGGIGRAYVDKTIPLEDVADFLDRQRA
ncbi:3-dehydroquinate synthase [Sphingomonas sp.]|jgi:3-dehydroquinate synthase|uniref:3-dehydroquinate synthase n=1 Tax=Sphingomonas sp. TaxID=28214 RepID=UPI002DE8A2E3|nr:3-dehydroquinate synthase [Sphingomonas sp.]HEV2569527.1 3-dehydroquinate synthase [Sphingomonas sp.]